MGTIFGVFEACNLVQLPQLTEAHDNCLLEYWGSIGIMEKKMETTIMGYIGVL